MNGDGKLDVLFLKSTSGGGFEVHVYFGNGNGTFHLAQVLTQTLACSLGDVNGDGTLDLIGINSISLGNGDGTFQQPLPFSGIGCPTVADFNGDGKLDLALPSATGVSILFGNGNGTFQSPVNNFLSMNLVSDPILEGDFNGDGKPDLFVERTQTVGTILLNSGSGKFQAIGASSYEFSELTDYFLGDFNNDGRTDVVSIGVGRIAIANADGTLPIPKAYLPAYGQNMVAVTAGDFNDDDKIDLVGVMTNLSFNDTGEYTVLLGKGAGRFGAPIQNATGDTGTKFVASADLNHDGKLDLVMASNSTIDVHLGLGNGLFQKASKYPFQRPTSMAIADFNGDGIPDLAVNATIFTGATVPGQVLLGNGDGTFRPGFALPGGIQSLAAGDFNHDGKMDLAIGFSKAVGIMLGNGDGTVQPISAVQGGESGSLVVADFNNDGDLDVAGVGVGTVSVYLGRGDGTVTASHFTLISQTSGLINAAVADFNGDGIPDIAVTTGNGLAVAQGKGTGYFQPVYFYPIGSTGLVTGDLDGDGTPDLAITTGDLLTVFLNKP